MYWNKEFNFKDPDVRYLYREYAAVVGIFTLVVLFAFFVGLAA